MFSVLGSWAGHVARLEGHVRELERTPVESQIRALSSDETELLRELGYVQDDG